MTPISRQRPREDDPSEWTLDRAGTAFITGLPAAAISTIGCLALCNVYGLHPLPTDALTTVILIGGAGAQLAVHRANLNPETPENVEETIAAAFNLGAITTLAARILWHCAR